MFVFVSELKLITNQGTKTQLEFSSQRSFHQFNKYMKCIWLWLKHVNFCFLASLNNCFFKEIHGQHRWWVCPQANCHYFRAAESCLHADNQQFSKRALCLLTLVSFSYGNKPDSDSAWHWIGITYWCTRSVAQRDQDEQSQELMVKDGNLLH